MLDVYSEIHYLSRNVSIRQDYVCNSVAFSSQVNYTYWATAIFRPILVLTFVDISVSRGHRGGSPSTVNLSCLDRSPYFLFQVAPHLSSRDW
jgi:hypothetical protein